MAEPAGLPAGTAALREAALDVERSYVAAPDRAGAEAVAAAWERVVTDRGFASAPDRERGVWLTVAGLSWLRCHTEYAASGALEAAVGHLEAALAALAGTGGDELAAACNLRHALVARHRRDGDPADLAEAARRLDAAVAATARGTQKRDMALAEVVWLLTMQTSWTPEDAPRRRIKAITELLAETTEPGRMPPRARAELYQHLGRAHLDLGADRTPADLAAAEAAYREARRLAVRLGDADAAGRLGAIADRIAAAAAEAAAPPGSLTLDEAVAWIHAAPDRPGRAERVRRLLRGAEVEGSAPEAVRLWLLSMAEELYNATATTTRADASEPIRLVESVLAGLDERAAAEEALVAHTLLAAMYTGHSGGRPGENAARADAHRARAARLSGTADDPRARADQAVESAHTLVRQGLTAREGEGGTVAEGEERVRAELAEAIAVYRSLGDTAALGRAHLVLGSLLRGSAGGGRAANTERALAELHAAEAALDPADDPVTWASIQHNLGAGYASRQVHGGREENLRRAAHHFRRCLTGHLREQRPHDWAVSRHALANALSQLPPVDGDEPPHEAVEAYAAAAEVFDRLGDRRAWASVQADLGSLFLDRARDPVRARTYFDTALAACGDDDLYLTAWCLAGSGAAIELMADSYLAEKAALDRSPDAPPEPLPPGALDQVLDTAEHKLGTAMDAFRALGRHTEWARTGMRLFRMRLSRTRSAPPSERAPVAELGLSVLDALAEHGIVTDSPRHADLLARLLAGLGRVEEAAEAGLRGLALADLGRQAALLRPGRRAELADASELAATTMTALFAVGRERDAVLVLERARARELGDALDRDRADLDRLAATDPAARTAFTTAAAALDAAQASERAGGWEGDGIERLERAGQARELMRAALERVRAVPGFANFLRPPDWDTIEAALAGGAPLVYLMPADGGTAIVLVARTPAGPASIDVWTAPALTAHTVAALANGAPDGDDGTAAAPGFLAAQARSPREFRAGLDHWSAVLGARLIGPLRRRLPDGLGGVVLVPYGLLGLFPLHTVPYDHAPDRCLLTDYDVAFAPSARAHAASLAAARRRHGAHRPQGVDKDDADGGPPILVGAGDPTGDLRYARAELAAAARLMGARAGPLLMGADATPERLLAAAAGAGYLHLACHTDHRYDDPLRSALVLAGGARLSLGDLLDRRALRGVRLVVASGCQTGATETVLPDEALSLATGLLHAGAGCVVASLWQVGDVSTALLVTRCYAELRGPRARAPAGALRAAQLWLRAATARELAEWCAALAALSPGDPALTPFADAGATLAAVRDPGRRPFAHPYHWAAFVVIGA
ncbi:CHAT domain-containing protein [Allonocardiopsis opalescens]|uniref:CHAT domain-containing protein n=1 Tax=Allonocardiopsis opalescens TaxID=1144618 RepID=A0A2T0Q245_9ACTN|nr:CHAT domain-containing protein [Allonocardiopsis opalescens]PRX97780.1 CHAT domain-containing protein [Allonocardiopsis opalescens]